jgi:hypothetical protein
MKRSNARGERCNDPDDREEEEVGKDPTVRPGGPPECKKTRATSPIAVQLQVQARDGLIPIEPFAVANERELGVDQ